MAPSFCALFKDKSEDMNNPVIISVAITGSQTDQRDEPGGSFVSC